MESVQSIPPRPPRKRDNLMYNEISSTSSEEGTNQKYNSEYKANEADTSTVRENASSDNEIEAPSRTLAHARNQYRSMGNINEKHNGNVDNRRLSDINCNIRSIEHRLSDLDVSLHSSEIKKFDSLKVPIVGYEVMEERARFTIYKLKVEDDSRDQSWLVFRRYTDFVRLYSRLKAVRPRAPLPLPAKRWFKDNFEPAFLEERARGLQVFVNALLRELPNHPLVREFFCLDEPPQAFSYQPEVQAVYGALEDSITSLKMQLKQKDATIMHLQRRVQQLEEGCNCSTNMKGSDES